jgi:MerR family transcriptional regulator, thiopeptide resistance regulator
MSYSIGHVARVAGVSVRTLHHYEEIGPLPVSERTSAGYRSYDESDLARLQRILYYREKRIPAFEDHDPAGGPAQRCGNPPAKAARATETQAAEVAGDGRRG